MPRRSVPAVADDPSYGTSARRICRYTDICRATLGFWEGRRFTKQRAATTTVPPFFSTDQLFQTAHCFTMYTRIHPEP